MFFMFLLYRMACHPETFHTERRGKYNGKPDGQRVMKIG
ncbi:hypothetical protein B4098_1846 [Heyndrickxia coagulans]|uniref:Uncharacterized protein n=1 Tax=Heyndrickxia coagulans TaxID=1398 RepID=A0A150JYR8_HEYCO|nr:hypothetical protein B4098_1846 [Heyndrickxia coagulans]